MQIKIFKKGLQVLLYRGLAAILVFLLAVFFARTLSVEDYGLFSLGFTMVTLVSVLVRCGLDNIVLKQVAANHLDCRELSNGYIYCSLRVVCFMSVLAFLVLYLSSGIISEVFFDKPKLNDVIVLLSWLVVPMSLSFILSEVNKALGRAERAAFYQALLPHFVSLLLFLVLWSCDSISIESVIYAILIGFCVSAITLLASVKKYAFEIEKIKISFFELLSQGFPMLLLSVGATVMSLSDTIISGLFLSSEEVGLYYAASRVVLVTTLVLVAMNSVTAPLYARYYKEGDLVALEKLAKRSSMVLWGVMVLPTCVFMFYSEWVMSFFGEYYIQGGPLLIVLCFGQLINVGSGSVGCLLTMTGNEKAMRDIILISAFMNILLSLVLVQALGVLGVAYATSISVIIWNFWAVVVVKKKLGFWMFKFYE